MVYLVPHSSHLTQPLDLTIFGVQKRFTTTNQRMQKISNQTDCLRKILNGLEMASTCENIISAFESAGIIRTFNKESIDGFNCSMPFARVEKKAARCFKDPSFRYYIDDYRIDLA